VEKSRKIIVIDDSPESLSLVEQALIAEGFSVFCANSFQDGLELLNREQPELLILDYDMPGLNGLEVLNLLRKQQNYIAVIFISATSDYDVVCACLNSGADDYIKKPFRLSEFVARVKVRFRIKDLHDELNRLNEQLKELSRRDSLTGLFNMKEMYQRIEFELKRAKRFRRQIACVMMDMDHFKTINDGADHLFGSFVLQEIAKIIVKNIRSIDLAARYGGDEFLVLLTEVDSNGAMIFAERLRNEISSSTFNDGKHSAKRTVSIGFAVSNPDDEIDPKAIVRRADHALYEAKNSGRNRVVENKSMILAPEKVY